MQQIDDTLYDAFGQRQVSTMYTQLNQYHVVMEVWFGFPKDDPSDLGQSMLRFRGQRKCRLPLSRPF